MASAHLKAEPLSMPHFKTSSALTTIILALLLAGFCAVVFQANIDVQSLISFWHLSIVGVIGATIANASGTGGGVVFLPVFNTLNDTGQLKLSQENILAASFLIQCFGMTMGAIIWCRKLRHTEENTAPISLKAFWKTAFYILALAIPAMLVTQYKITIDPIWTLFAFKIFSICLGLAVIFTTLKSRNFADRKLKSQISKYDLIFLLVIAPIGGVANALFSVGLGEIVALFLFMRGYCIVTSSGLAVLVSSVSVIFGAPYHILSDNVPWVVVAFTAPGALLGGFIARSIALKLGAYKLKIIAGSWIAMTGFLLLSLKLL